MKAVGAVLLLGACVLFGFGWTGSMRKKIRLLDGICGGLQRMETDLRQRSRPLAEMMEQEGLTELAGQLREGKLFFQAAEPMTVKMEQLFGPGEAVSAVRELAWNLGRYDCATQAAACKRACARLESCKEQLEQELLEKKRLYHTVPVALGCVVLLVVM